MSRGKVIRMSAITRDFVTQNPDKVFVFGDNMMGRGYGGQARAMRGARNAIGIPTKWAPDMRESSFFTDADAGKPEVVGAIYAAFERIIVEIEAGKDVVWPADGIGTGLAQLNTRAPTLFKIIEDFLGQITEGAA